MILLELGIIESQSFQISTPDTYRKIKSGQYAQSLGLDRRYYIYSACQMNLTSNFDIAVELGIDFR